MEACVCRSAVAIICSPCWISLIASATPWRICSMTASAVSPWYSVSLGGVTWCAATTCPVAPTAVTAVAVPSASPPPSTEVPADTGTAATAATEATMVQLIVQRFCPQWSMLSRALSVWCATLSMSSRALAQSAC